MKVGDYVRTNLRNEIVIRKVIDIIHNTTMNDNRMVFDKPTKFTYYVEDNKDYESSQNIIDLIEVGDVLVVKDFVDEACMIFTDIYLIQNEQQLINIKSDLEKNKNKKLYSIVTSEQFSQMEYRIGE